jgi:hypothetical protein
MMMALSLHVEHSEIKSDREHKPHQHPAPRCSRLPAPIACGRRGCCARYTSPLTNVASAGRAPGRSKRRRKRSARFRRIGRSPRALRPAIAPAPEASRDRAATSLDCRTNRPISPASGSKSCAKFVPTFAGWRSWPTSVTPRPCWKWTRFRHRGRQT